MCGLRKPRGENDCGHGRRAQEPCCGWPGSCRGACHLPSIRRVAVRWHHIWVASVVRWIPAMQTRAEAVDHVTHVARSRKGGCVSRSAYRQVDLRDTAAGRIGTRVAWPERMPGREGRHTTALRAQCDGCTHLASVGPRMSLQSRAASQAVQRVTNSHMRKTRRRRRHSIGLRGDERRVRMACRCRACGAT